MAKILIVDDEPNFCSATARLLRSHGHEVHAALTAADAQEYLEASLPEVILLDFLMPGLDGPTFCKALRRDPRAASLPIIMITAQSSDRSIVTALRAGVDDYLVKPVEAELLFEKIDQVLDQAKRGTLYSQIAGLQRGAERPGDPGGQKQPPPSSSDFL